MNLLFRHILVAYDGSVSSQKALDKAIALVDLCGGTKLTIVHVMNVMPSVTGDILFSPTPAMERQMAERAESLIKEAKRRAAGVVRLKTSILHGIPAKVIMEQAEELGCDLIIVGSRGLGKLGGWVLGSVSHHVVQHARVPVMVLK